MKELYITHSINQFGELEDVIDQFGAGGYGFYWHLLERIAKSDGALPTQKLLRVASEVGLEKSTALECTSLLEAMGLVRKEMRQTPQGEAECLVSDSITGDIDHARQLSEAGRKAITARWAKYKAGNSGESSTVIRPYSNRSTNGHTTVILNTNTDINTDTNTNADSDIDANTEAIKRESSLLKNRKNSKEKKKETLLFSDDVVEEMNGRYGRFEVIRVMNEIRKADNSGILRSRDADALLRSWLKHKSKKNMLPACPVCGHELGEDQTCPDCHLKFQWNEKQYRWVEKEIK